MYVGCAALETTKEIHTGEVGGKSSRCEADWTWKIRLQANIRFGVIIVLFLEIG